MRFLRRRKPNNSPVLIVDSLGMGQRIEASAGNDLCSLADELDGQFHRFRAKVPHSMVVVTRRRVFGTREFSTLRFNDMFVLFSERPLPDPALRYMVSGLLLYHQLLIAGSIPRGGLGFGAVLRKRDIVLGTGFLDAYRMAEKRSDEIRNVCAFAISPSFLAHITNSEHSYRLLCLYNDHFFLNPRALTDPDMGLFDNIRILSLLRQSGANPEKLEATQHFLENLEDYDDAMLPGSRSRFLTGWTPRDPDTGHK